MLNHKWQKMNPISPFLRLPEHYGKGANSESPKKGVEWSVHLSSKLKQFPIKAKSGAQWTHKKDERTQQKCHKALKGFPWGCIGSKLSLVKKRLLGELATGSSIDASFMSTHPFWAGIPADASPLESPVPLWITTNPLLTHQLDSGGAVSRSITGELLGGAVSWSIAGVLLGVHSHLLTSLQEKPQKIYRSWKLVNCIIRVSRY